MDVENIFIIVLFTIKIQLFSVQIFNAVTMQWTMNPAWNLHSVFDVIYWEKVSRLFHPLTRDAHAHLIVILLLTSEYCI